MPTYVVLHHTNSGQAGRNTHFDLMLEDLDHLLTWSVLEWPLVVQNQFAQKLPDHRLAYLDYEGPISQNRGHVRRVERGTFHWRTRDERMIDVELVASNGRVSLRLTHVADDQWVCSMEPSPS